MTLALRFLETARKNPSEKILHSEEHALTYGEIIHLSALLAKHLITLTDKPHVGILMPTVPAFAPLYFGILMAGKTPVPLNYLLDTAELDYIYKDADIDTVLGTKQLAAKITDTVKNRLWLEDMTATAGTAAAVDTDRLARVSANDVGTILYTSGTTGVPKGVMLTHNNLLSNVEAARQGMTITPDDAFLGALPLFHSFAMLATFLLPLINKNRVFFQKRFIPQNVLESIEQQRLSVILAVPSMYRLLMRIAQKKGSTLEPVRIAIAGGEPLLPDVRNEFMALTGKPLLEGYGLTETSPVVCVNSATFNKPGTAGKVIPDVQVKIIDDGGAELPRGRDGEIIIKGPNVMKGYLNKPADTDAVLKDGWFYTGDMGRLDDDNFLTITGRIKDMIISSGENIYPAEIEAVINTHPCVFESAVIGAPDPARVEVPKAYVQLHEGKTLDEHSLREFLRGKIADYKIPKYVEFRKELPHGPTGKILKKILKQELKASQP